MTTTGVTTSGETIARAAIGLAAATVVAWIVLAAIDTDGAAWLILPVLGAATALTAWRAGGSSPRNVRAFVPLVIGVLAVVVFLIFVIADA